MLRLNEQVGCTENDIVDVSEGVRLAESVGVDEGDRELDVEGVTEPLVTVSDLDHDGDWDREGVPDRDNEVLLEVDGEAELDGVLDRNVREIDGEMDTAWEAD